MFSTAWTIYFAVVWWIYTPHDGRQEITSPAQREIMEAGGGGNSSMTAAERTAAATAIWNEEKGTSMAVIVVGWLIKVCTPIRTSTDNFMTMIRFTLHFYSIPTLSTCAKDRITTSR